MVEIQEETTTNIDHSGGGGRRGRNGDGKTVEITLKTVGPARPSRLLVPTPIKVHALRKLIARSKQLPVENLRLILRGNVLNSEDGEDAALQLSDGDSMLVAFRPKPPAKHLRDDVYIDDDDLDQKFQLPPSTSQWKRRLFHFLHKKFKIPDILLMAIFSLSLKAWAFIIVWFILAPVAHRWDLGPLYILGTAFCVIFLNLGQRQPGEISAYSIFNDDFRELRERLTQIVWIETFGQDKFDLCNCKNTVMVTLKRVETTLNNY